MTTKRSSELFLRSGLTEVSYRKKFRSSQPDTSERSRQFAERLRSYLKNWIELVKVNETQESLMCLIFKEKFMNSVFLYLAMYRSKKTPQDLTESISFTLP